MSSVVTRREHFIKHRVAFERSESAMAETTRRQKSVMEHVSMAIRDMTSRAFDCPCDSKMTVPVTQKSFVSVPLEFQSFGHDFIIFAQSQK